MSVCLLACMFGFMYFVGRLVCAVGWLAGCLLVLVWLPVLLRCALCCFVRVVVCVCVCACLFAFVRLFVLFVLCLLRLSVCV